MSEQKIHCSVLVLTRNSAANLERCLKNLGQFAEILVHDANSEDDSVAIAKSFGARVLKQYDTDEPSVRITDFTEMRLKQRADAAYDWVFYIDSDEYLSGELPAEIGAILATAHEKVIIKLPRMPKIEGVVRTHGAFFPEIMPRIHHRKGGCTLKGGKMVHEKYVYDDSFEEVITKHALIFPLPSLDALQSKDDRYITLEVERIRRDGMSWYTYVRWVLLREPVVMAYMMLKILLNAPRYARSTEVPLAHEWRYVRYHWRLFRALSGATFYSHFKAHES